MVNHSLFKNLKWLDISKNKGYGLLPIPSQLDEQISSLIKEWKNLGALERQATSRSLTEEQMSTLLAYSERMASLAVRLGSRELVLLGLLALGIGGFSDDWRENTLVLCLHFNASIKIGVPPELPFEEAAKFLPAEVCVALASFLERSPEDQSLAAMGYKESNLSEGFRYQRTW
jgi:hypothetical protein